MSFTKKLNKKSKIDKLSEIATHYQRTSNNYEKTLFITQQFLKDKDLMKEYKEYLENSDKPKEE